MGIVLLFMVHCDSRGGLHCAGTQKCGKFLRLHVHPAHKLDDLQILLFGFLRFQLPKLLLILRDLGLGFLDVLFDAVKLTCHSQNSFLASGQTPETVKMGLPIV